ncbi:MAG: hypothetical protein J6K89_03920 [Oscillospiraceae bacterium]|nr:hypothetical protein [Oscillospiraceae bacterium]
MKIKFVMDVKVPDDLISEIPEFHGALQDAFADVLMEYGMTTDGIRRKAPGGVEERAEG